MQAYDVTRKRVVNIEREENGVIIAYSLPDDSMNWFFPLIENGKNVEPYEILEENKKVLYRGCLNGKKKDDRSRVLDR